MALRRKASGFQEVTGPNSYNQPIEVRAIVSGKSLAPYYVPKVVEVECRTGKDCDHCQFEGARELELKPGDEKILFFVDAKAGQAQWLMRQVFGIRCQKFAHRVVSVQNVERVFIGQMPGKDRVRDHGVRLAYFVGQGLEVNRGYRLRGYTTVDPSNQTVTHVFTEAERLESDMEGFASRGEYRDLREFELVRPTVSRVYDRLEEIYTFYARNLTRIYHRFDLHLCVDLTFRSVLSFQFGSEVVHRGWMDVMVIGDTRTGKGFVTKALIDWFGLGESVSGECCTLAGLVAGLDQYGKQWVVKWGKLPMNDCGLLVIDEAERLGDAWQLLSRVRSEGRVEVTKIHTQQTQARCRLISLCNPPLRNVANYSYGIQAVRDVVKADEDIARFDAVLILAHDEVGIDEINAPTSKMAAMFSREAERRLVLWAWSRRQDQVLFTDDAVKTLYDVSIKLGKMYDFSIPLIQGEDIRMKVARVSAAFAARFFSHRRDGEILVVERVHVECAYVFFDVVYQKEASGYYVYSQVKRPTYSAQEGLREVEQYFLAYRNHQHVYKALLMMNNIVANDLVEILVQPKEVVNETLSLLLKYDCIEKRGPTYVKKPIFSSWLRKKVSRRVEGCEEGNRDG